MRVIAVVLFASGVVSSYAACSNNCNGKGTCGAYDKCICFNSHDGGAHDCSKRRCPYGLSWSSTSTSRVYKECSDAGICNTGTGECGCFDGFTGHNCGRKTCPNDCSGHGDCQTVKTWGLTTAWDSDMTQACKCDPGYTGIACNERLCPLGDDPLTSGSTNMIQTCTLAYDSVNAGTVGGGMALQLTDWTGQVHTTRSITLTHGTTSALSIQEAIQALPNNVFETVTIGPLTSAASGTDWSWTISFTSQENTGTIPIVRIVLGTADTAGEGNQPRLAAATGLVAASSICSQTNPAPNTEALVCSGRGNCKSDEGLCQCGRGYYGRACEFQTSIQ